MEVVLAVLVALGVPILSALGRLAVLANRHRVITVGIGCAVVLAGGLFVQSQLGAGARTTDYSSGDAALRALIVTL